MHHRIALGCVSALAAVALCGHCVAEVIPNAFDPAWSPDGAQLAFASARSGNAEVYVCAADGSSVKRLTSNRGADRSPSWSPDGKRIAFTSSIGGRSIWLMAADGSGQVQPFKPGAGDVDSSPSWMPDGQAVVFSRAKGNGSEVMIARLDGSAPVALTNTPDVAETSPRCSPDGSLIAYVVPRAGLWVMKADGSAARRVIAGQIADAPDWSPDGKRLLYATAAGEVHVVNPDGTGDTVVPWAAAGQQQSCPAWSPDGKRIACVVNEGGMAVAVVELPAGLAGAAGTAASAVAQVPAGPGPAIPGATRAQAPGHQDLADWPVVFEAPLTAGDPKLAELALCQGQYANPPTTDESGLTLHAGWSHTALWVSEPMGDASEVSVKVRFPQEHGPLIVWLGGPGRGRAIEAGYCALLMEDRVELRRDGVTVKSEPLATKVPVEQDMVVRATRVGGRISIALDGVDLLEYEDAAPLDELLTSRVGYGGDRCRVRDLKVRAPMLSAERIAAMRDVPLIPPSPQKPAPNGELIFRATPEDVKANWVQHQPEALTVHGDALVLFNWNGTPQAWYPTPVQGDVAFEVEFEYVPTAWLAPATGIATAAGHYLTNGGPQAEFRMDIAFADELPGPESLQVWNPALRWSAWLPICGGCVELRSSRAGTEDHLARHAYAAPTAGHRYTARLERIGDTMRLFLDGVFIAEAQSPEDPGEKRPYFVGFRQHCSGNLVYAARAYRL